MNRVRFLTSTFDLALVCRDSSCQVPCSCERSFRASCSRVLGFFSSSAPAWVTTRARTASTLRTRTVMVTPPGDGIRYEFYPGGRRPNKSDCPQPARVATISPVWHWRLWRNPMRVGIGHDTHRLEAGRPLILGGVRLEHPRGLAGHSDADVVLHALTDALLGAAGLGDIGDAYPDTDPRWHGA